MGGGKVATNFNVSSRQGFRLWGLSPWGPSLADPCLTLAWASQFIFFPGQGCLHCCVPSWYIQCYRQLLLHVERWNILYGQSSAKMASSCHNAVMSGCHHVVVSLCHDVIVLDIISLCHCVMKSPNHHCDKLTDWLTYNIRNYRYASQTKTLDTYC